jgi:hypothetical protein
MFDVSSSGIPPNHVRIPNNEEVYAVSRGHEVDDRKEHPYYQTPGLKLAK